MSDMRPDCSTTLVSLNEKLVDSIPDSGIYYFPASEALMFPQLFRFTDLALLLLRLMAGVVFVTSGWTHVTKPAERSQSIGMSKGFTVFLGLAELAGSLGIIFGVFQQLAAIGLILIMLGAVYKKIEDWHTGFWGEKSSGWHYDLTYAVMCFVILVTDGGRYVLMH